jgi:two-component system CheB/CheR fusion protein
MKSSPRKPVKSSHKAPTAINAKVSSRMFPIVGIGASAGGLEAFSELLRYLPERTGMAFVLVQHLDPKHESGLQEILSRTTKIPVTEVTQGMVVQPDQAYVIPANTYLTIKNGVLQLGTRVLTVDNTCRSMVSSVRWRKIRGSKPSVSFCPERPRMALKDAAPSRQREE